MTSRKTLGLAVFIALLVSVVGGLVVYASLSEQLDIQGSGDFVPESWKVNFKAGTLSAPILTQGGSVDTAPTLSDTMISNFKVVLTQPGDAVAYTFDVENTGSLDARLTTYNLGTPTCTGTGATAVADATIVCSSHLTYTLKYISGDLATNGLSAGQNVTHNDILMSGTTVKLELNLSYSSAASVQPENTVEIGGLNSTLIYTVAQ